MNERLLEYLPDPNTVKGGIAAIVETIQTEAPELVEEIIRWAIAVRTLWLILFITLAFLVVYLAKKLPKAEWYKVAINDKHDPTGEFAWAGLIVAAIVSIIGISVSIGYLLKPLLVPRLFIIEYITNLFK